MAAKPKKKQPKKKHARKKAQKGVVKTKARATAKGAMAPATDGMAALATAVPPPETVIHARPGDTLTLSATVTNAVVAYAVSYDKRLKLFQLVSGSSSFAVGGVDGHVIGWAFNELPASNWTHRLTA